MKILLTLFMLLNLVSCGSMNFNDPIASAKFKAENLKQNDKLLGDDLPDWIDQEGVHNGYIYVIGEYENSAELSNSYLLEAAKADAEMQIVNRMPASYKLSLSKILDKTQIDKLERSFSKEISLKGLSELTFSRKKQVCRKKITHSSFGEEVKTVCYVQAKIPVSVYNLVLQQQLKLINKTELTLPKELKTVTSNQ